MDSQTLAWIRRLKGERGVTQEKLGEVLGVSQSAAGKKLRGEIGLSIEDIENLERFFSQNAPIRAATQINGKDFSVRSDVISQVIIHIAEEFDVIDADPYEFSRVFLDLCKYVQESDRQTLTASESRLAMGRVLEGQ